MVELEPVTPDSLAWVLQWLEVPLSGESEIVKADEVERLHRDLLDRSEQNPAVAVSTAAGAASVAVQLFELLTERDPEAAGQYVGDLKRRLAEN